jgi:hypothetical protein
MSTGTNMCAWAISVSARPRKRKPGSERGLRILHDRDPAALLDAEQTRRAIAQVAGEQGADDSVPIVVRGAAEERVDRRPMPVFLGAAAETSVPVLDEQVAVRLRDVDPLV